MGQSGHDRREEIDVSGAVHACGAQPFGHEVDELAGRLHRGSRRFEAGDGALEEQLVANDPGGDRWVLLARRVVEVLVADVDRRSARSTKKPATTRRVNK